MCGKDGKVYLRGYNSPDNCQNTNTYYGFYSYKWRLTSLGEYVIQYIVEGFFVLKEYCMYFGYMYIYICVVIVGHSITYTKAER